jgi:hypothetical protein
VTSAVLETARGYVAAGLSVIRVRANGTKAPLDTDWREYATRRATDAELAAWFHPDIVCGIGIAGGPASGNLAVLDFETWWAYTAWLRSLPPALEALTRRCPLVQCPRGGAHLYARMTDPVPGTVLARHVPDPLDVDERTGRPKVKTLIEVRGDGMQVVAPGSPPQCHPLHREYEFIRRGWLDPAVTAAPIELEAWFAWLEYAAALNQVEREPEAARPVAPPKPRPADAGVKPGDDFNRRGTWEETGLFEAGWTWFQQLDGDRGFVTRPGKKRSEGKSGTLGLVSSAAGGHPLFYAFTSDCAPFEERKSYSKWRVYALLKHGGDHVAAARALGAAGYGDQSKPGKGPSVTFTGSHAAPESNSGATKDAAGNEPPAANPGAKPPLPIVHYDDVVPVLDTADFVEGLLIDGAMTVVYGESNCGKTFFMLDLALHVAAGLPWRGLDVSKRGVLYLALEGAYGITNRVAAFKRDRANVADLAFAFVPVPLNLHREDGDTLRVIEAAKAAASRMPVPVGLVVVDTLSRAMAGGNENSPEDMTAFVEQVDLIRSALPAHLVAVHHCGKDSARGARGHSSLRAATDTEIEVSRDPGSKTSVARVTKQRDLEGGAEYPFQLVPVELGRNLRGKPIGSCVVRHLDADGRPTKEDKAVQADRVKRQKEREQEAHDERAVMLVIDAEAAKGLPGASISWIEDHADCTRGRSKAAVNRLVERGELVVLPDFERPIGKGGMRTIVGGYGRPREAD